jgi:hypothetical protein
MKNWKNILIGLLLLIMAVFMVGLLSEDFFNTDIFTKIVSIIGALIIGVGFLVLISVPVVLSLVFGIGLLIGKIKL